MRGKVLSNINEFRRSSRVQPQWINNGEWWFAQFVMLCVNCALADGGHIGNHRRHVYPARDAAPALGQSEGEKLAQTLCHKRLMLSAGTPMATVK